MAANNVAAQISLLDGGNGKVVLWEGMIADSTGDAVTFPDQELVSLHGYGTFDTSGTITIEGKNGGGTYGTLQDGIGGAMTFTAAAVKTTLTPTVSVRPRTTANGAGGLVDVDVYALFRSLR